MPSLNKSKHMHLSLVGSEMKTKTVISADRLYFSSFVCSGVTMFFMSRTYTNNTMATRAPTAVNINIPPQK